VEEFVSKNLANNGNALDDDEINCTVENILL
jgi:hypothetical protein